MIHDTHVRRWTGPGWAVEAVRNKTEGKRHWTTGINISNRDVLSPSAAHDIAAALTEAAIWCAEVAIPPPNKRREKRRQK